MSLKSWYRNLLALRICNRRLNFELRFFAKEMKILNLSCPIRGLNLRYKFAVGLTEKESLWPTLLCSSSNSSHSLKLLRHCGKKYSRRHAISQWVGIFPYKLTMEGCYHRGILQMAYSWMNKFPKGVKFIFAGDVVLDEQTDGRTVTGGAVGSSWHFSVQWLVTKKCRHGLHTHFWLHQAHYFTTVSSCIFL